METTTSTTGHRPLDGIRVLDLSRLLPGPYCSQLLADMGAEVIKVETPLAGDYARMAPAELGLEGIFAAVNRGKRSIALDYRRPAGRDTLLRLARTADVFIESSRPGQMARHGLGETDVRSANPDIVYCSLSGYGQSGPDRDRPGHDIDYLATSGVLAIMGRPGDDVTPPALQLADLSAGTLAAVRILAELVARSRGAAGAYVDVSLLDAPLSWLDTLGSGIERSGSAPGALSGAYPCYQVYEAADGVRLAVGALELPFWSAFCRDIERPDLARRQFDPDAISDVAALVATRTAAEWLDRFSADACVARVNLPAEALADPAVQLRKASLAGGGAAPVLGADTLDVLAASGLGPERIASLQRSGAVADRQTPERAARAARLGAMLSRRGAHKEATAA